MNSCKTDHPQAGLLKAFQVAEMLSITERHVRNLPLPRVALGSRCVRYRRADVEALVQSKLEGAAGERGGE